MASQTSSSGDNASMRVSTSVAGPNVAEIDFVPVISNNNVVDLNPNLYEERLKIMAEFLQHHYISYALNAYEEVPYLFLQEFWATVRFDKEAQSIKARIDSNLEICISKRNLRWILRLPRAERFPTKVYDDLPTSSEIIQTLKEVGYKDDIRLLSQFRRMKLPPVWNFLFSVLNRCLTGKKGGFDQGNFNILSIFHGLVNNLNLDYAQLIWNDLKAVTEEGHKGKSKFIPYPRFWGLCIKVTMDSENIALSAERKQTPLQKMQIFRTSVPDSDFPMSMALNSGMLSHIPTESSILLRYKGQMGVSEPSHPTHVPSSMSNSGEGSESEHREISEHISDSKSEEVSQSPSETRATTQSTSSDSQKSRSIETDRSRPRSLSDSRASHSPFSQQRGDSDIGEPLNENISPLPPTEFHVHPESSESIEVQEIEPTRMVVSDGETGLNKFIGHKHQATRQPCMY